MKIKGPVYYHQGKGYSYLASERTEGGAERDWYIHISPSTGWRDLFCRFGAEPEDSTSTTIGGTVQPNQLILAAYNRGFEFSDKELIEFGHQYLEEKTNSLIREQLNIVKGDDWDTESLLGASNRQCPTCFQRRTMSSGDGVHEGYDGFPVCGECKTV